MCLGVSVRVFSLELSSPCFWWGLDDSLAWVGCNLIGSGTGIPTTCPAFGYLRELSNWLLINVLPAEVEKKGLWAAMAKQEVMAEQELCSVRRLEVPRRRFRAWSQPGDIPTRQWSRHGCHTRSGAAGPRQECRRSEGKPQPARPGAAHHHHLARCCPFSFAGTARGGWGLLVPASSCMVPTAA